MKIVTTPADDVNSVESYRLIEHPLPFKGVPYVIIPSLKLIVVAPPHQLESWLQDCTTDTCAADKTAE